MITRDAFLVEANEILRIIGSFKCLLYEQVVMLDQGKRDAYAKAVNLLCKQKRIVRDVDRGLIAETQTDLENINHNIIKCFWIFLRFASKSEYYTAGEFPVIIDFFANYEHFEIIYIPMGNEALITFALPKSEKNCKRIVVLDKEEQSENLEIPNLLCYSLLDEYNNVQLFSIE